MPWRIAVGLLVILPACFLVLSMRSREAARVRHVSEETYQLLSTVGLPTADVSPADLDEAIKRLNAAVASSPLRGKRIFARWSEARLPSGFAQRHGGWKPLTKTMPFSVPKSVPHLPGLDPQPTEDEMIWRLMEKQFPSETRSHVPLPEIMELMHLIFDCFAGERGDTIFFVCGARPLVERTFTPYGGTAHMRTSTGSGDDVSAWFKAQGVGFAYEGAGARLSGKEKVTVRSTQDDVDLCWAMLGDADGTLWERVQEWYWDCRIALRSHFGKP